MPHVPAYKKHKTVPLEPTFDLPRILNQLALEQLEREEAEEVAYLRVWEVSDPDAS